MTTETQTRRTWRALFILAQLVLVGLLGLSVLANVSTGFAVLVATLSVALSSVYIALRI